MQVLVTRPEPEATRTAALLRARGHTPHVMPLARIERLQPALPPADTIDAVLLTSANAAFALEGLDDVPVYTVGAATARAASAAGAGQVTPAGGDWQSLAELLRNTGPGAGARLLHLSGAEIRGDLEGVLTRAGHVYTRRIVYTVRPAAWLTPETAARLEAGALEAALFFSPAHATIWHHLIERAALAHRLFALRAMALSPAVAAALAALPWREIRVAAAADAVRLIDRLEA